MSSIPLPENAGRVDTFTRSEGEETVHMQSVVAVDPATGEALALAQEATLTAVNTAVATLNDAAVAIKSAVETLNSKTTAVNTSAIAGTVALDSATLGALESINAATGLTQPLTDAQLRAVAVPVSGAFYPATQPVSASALPLPAGAASETTLAEVAAKLPGLSAGRLPVELPAGAASLTDGELRASPVPVSVPAIGAADDAQADSDSGSFSLVSLFKRLLGKLPELINGGVRLAGYDTGDDMIKVKSVQKKWRDSFVGTSLNAAKWDSSLGAGGAITVGGGTLTLGSGTTAGAETSVMSKETFTVPFRANVGITLSQRIANQTFLVEAVSVNPATGVPDGQHCVALLWDGTTATQAKYRVQNSGATPLDSSASTFPTSASGGFYELEPFADEAWFHGGTLDSTSGRANSYRRHQQIPEPNAVFKIRLRWLNGGTAPASNTNAVVRYITVQDYAELTAEITAGRGQSVAGQGVGVNVIGTVPVSGTVTANEGTPVTPSASILNSAASTNGTVVKASAGTIYGVVLANNGASDAWFKLHNSTAVTVGTTAVAMWIKIPAGANVNMQWGSKGLRHSTGICYSITGAVADADTTAIAAGQVKVNLSYV
jgi:hypothetical protein